MCVCRRRIGAAYLTSRTLLQWRSTLLDLAVSAVASSASRGWRHFAVQVVWRLLTPQHALPRPVVLSLLPLPSAAQPVAHPHLLWLLSVPRQVLQLRIRPVRVLQRGVVLHLAVVRHGGVLHLGAPC